MTARRESAAEPLTGPVYLAGRQIRLFRRRDRPTRFWQAAFRRAGHARPLVKSTGETDLAAARRWALEYLAGLAAPKREIASNGTRARRPGEGLAGDAPGEGHTGDAPVVRREDLLAAYPFPRIRQKKRHVERELALRILSVYERNPTIAQRSLARLLSVSPAIVNAYTARAMREGWLLKLERARARGRGYRYVLTDLGRGRLRDLLEVYLAQELSLFRGLAAEMRAMLAASGGRPVVLLGGGELAAIARLVLAEAGCVPLLDIETAPGPAELARLRPHPDAIVWLTGPAARAIPGHAATRPALLRELGHARPARPLQEGAGDVAE